MWTKVRGEYIGGVYMPSVGASVETDPGSLEVLDVQLE